MDEDFTADICGAPDEIRPYNFEPLMRNNAALNESVSEGCESDEEDNNEDDLEAQGDRRSENLAW